MFGKKRSSKIAPVVNSSPTDSEQQGRRSVGATKPQRIVPASGVSQKKIQNRPNERAEQRQRAAVKIQSKIRKPQSQTKVNEAKKEKAGFAREDTDGHSTSERRAQQRQSYQTNQIKGPPKDFQQSTENIKEHSPSLEDIYQKKMLDPSISLSLDEQLGLLKLCIERSLRESSKAADKDLIVWLGNTGSGKSTAINFLFGCQMQYKIHNISKKAVLDVIPCSEGGPYDAVAEIGQSMKSKTLFPHVVQNSDSNDYFCDFPGFMDSRGPEINIANSIGITNILNSARSLRFFLCIRYSSLFADRGKSFFDTLKAVEQLFGSRASFLQHIPCIIVGITCAPHDSLIQIQNFLTSNLVEDLALTFSCNLCLICPIFGQPSEGLYTVNEEYSRLAILGRLQKLRPLPKESLMFSTIIAADDTRFLMSLENIIQQFVARQLDTKDYKNVQKIKDIVQNTPLNISEGNQVHSLLNNAILLSLQRHSSKLKGQFFGKCLQGSQFNVNGAEEALRTLESFSSHFEDFADISSLKDYLKKSKELYQLYCQTRKGQDQVIQAQLKLRLILQKNILNEALLKKFESDVNECIEDVEKAIASLPDELIQEAHRFELDQLKLFFSQKKEEFFENVKNKQESIAIMKEFEGHTSIPDNIIKNEAPIIKARGDRAFNESNIFTDTKLQEQVHLNKEMKEDATTINSTSTEMQPKLSEKSLLPGWKPYENNLLRKRINSRTACLDTKEKLHLLKSCLRHGMQQSEAIKDKDLVVFIGNSGAGKSTLVNLLSGCEFAALDQPNGSICVKSLEEGGLKDEVSPIGHGVDSCTLFPVVIESNNANEVYCDCPGFGDTRGLELSLGNVLYLTSSFSKASGIKFVVLLNYLSLESDRGKAALDMFELCFDIFKTKENFLLNLESILILLTHVPSTEKENALDYIKGLAQDDETAFSAFLLKIVNRMYILDPLESGTKEKIDSLIGNLQILRSFEYGVAVSSENESELLTLMTRLNDEIRSHVVENQSFPQAASGLELFFDILKPLISSNHKQILAIAQLLKVSVETYLQPYMDKVAESYLQQDSSSAHRILAMSQGILKLIDPQKYESERIRYEEQKLETEMQRFYEDFQQNHLMVEKVLNDAVGQNHHQKVGLVRLFLSTAGASWKKNKNWISNPKISEWEGVACDDRGNVISLELRANNLTGMLPDNLFEGFEHIEHLDISENKLVGEVPVSIGRIRTFKMVLLNDNPDLVGAVPDSIKGIAAIHNTWLDNTSAIRLQSSSFPLWVCQKRKFLELERFYFHEEAKKVNGLMVLLSSKGNPSFEGWRVLGGENTNAIVTRNQMLFVSHRWLAKKNPDDAEGSKLLQIKSLLKKTQLREVEYLWIDFFCVPQDPAHSEKQQWAINSLPHYVKCAKHFVTLAGEHGEAEFSIYENRGWCRLERFAALTPATNSSGSTLETSMWVHLKEKDLLETAEISLEKSEKLCPLRGIFFDSRDKVRIAKSLHLMCFTMMSSPATPLRKLGSELIETDELKEHYRIANEGMGSAFFEEDEAARIIQRVWRKWHRKNKEEKLNKILPSLEKGLKAIQSLKKSDLEELKSLKRPPPAVEEVMKAILLLFAQEGTTSKTWKELLNTHMVIEKCLHFQWSSISDDTLQKLQRSLNEHNLNPENLKQVSRAAASLSTWLHAMAQCAAIYKGFETKTETLEKIQNDEPPSQDQQAVKAQRRLSNGSSKRSKSKEMKKARAEREGIRKGLTKSSAGKSKKVPQPPSKAPQSSKKSKKKKN